MTINKAIFAVAGVCFIGIMGVGIWHQQDSGWRSRDIYDWEITPGPGQTDRSSGGPLFNSTCVRLSIQHKASVPEWIFVPQSSMTPEEITAYTQKMQQVDQTALEREIRLVGKTPVDPSFCSPIRNWTVETTIIQQ